MSHRTIARTKPPIAPRKPLRLICECVHPDALTCLAQQHHTTRFNAMIVFGQPNKPGECTCACHRDKHNQSVNEQQWLLQRARTA